MGHQILHALQITGDRYRIICTDADPYSFGLYRTPCRYVVPNAAEADYVPSIVAIIKREKVDIILPGSEPEVRMLAKVRDRLSEVGCLFVASPSEVIDRCSDKKQLFRWLADQGIGTPQSAGADDVRGLLEHVAFPIVAKPARDSGGSRNVQILANLDEVDRYIDSFPGRREEIIFQEYVGDADSEYTVGIVVGAEGTIIDSIVLHRKLMGLSLGVSRTINGITYACSTGYSQGFIIRHRKIQEFCESLCLRMGMRGPVNIQLRLHGEDIKVFEIHPRFSGTTSIRSDAGFNDPDLVIRSFLLGERPSRQNFRTDVAAIRAFQSVLVPVSEMAEVPRIRVGEA